MKEISSFFFSDETMVTSASPCNSLEPTTSKWESQQHHGYTPVSPVGETYTPTPAFVK